MTNFWRKPYSMRTTARAAASIVMASMLLLVFVPGCNQNPSPPASKAATQSDPKAMFEEIFKAFNHEITNDLPQIATAGDGGFTTLKTNRTVSHELFPPTDSDPTYRAKISINTKSSFTFRPTPSDEEANKEEGSRKNSEPEGSSDFGLPTLGGIDLTGDSPSADKNAPQGLLPPQEDDDVQVYELAFENDRWVLKTETDPDTERFIQATFDFVLGRQ